MKIFINSYNRADRISTHKLLDGFDFQIVLHDEQQKDEYLKNKTINPETFLVCNQPFGLVNARNWILENLVKEGEWYLLLDDNILRFEAVVPPWSEHELLAVKSNPKMLRGIFENPVSFNVFLEICKETIVEAERRRARLAGFAGNVNFYFRERKWRDVGQVIGKTQLIKKTDLRYDLNVKHVDDYLWTAQNLERFGRVLINNYAVAIKGHFQKGGIGNYEERLPQRIKDIEYLCQRFPGMFRHAMKQSRTEQGGERDPRAEIAVRFIRLDQVEKWRALMRARV